ncbi:MAG: ABC transporter substrate-binding protein [Rhodocyclaceae bacterium]|nr:ABC transporter substrate-binding protein [Rhodocyclaceae bacterium]
MKRMLVFFAALFFAAGAIAADVAPDQLVKDVTTEVLDIVRQDKDIRSGNTKKTLELVENKVLPHFNFTRMTQLALGKDARKATPEQLAALTEEFRTLLVRTYSKALTEYRDQQIVFKPTKIDAGVTDVKVRTEIKQSGGKPIALDYYLEKLPAGWKVYDMEVGGVSLVTNYRSSFAQEIQAGGIDGLIKSLQAKNKTGETVAKPK